MDFVVFLITNTRKKMLRCESLKDIELLSHNKNDVGIQLQLKFHLLKSSFCQPQDKYQYQRVPTCMKQNC